MSLQIYSQALIILELICKPLQVEDYSLQAAAFASPPKWHLAHTSWFFETFLLKPFLANYQCFHPLFEQLFNSYYNSVGEQHPRAEHGLLSRPSVDQVFDYRKAINTAMQQLLSQHDRPNRSVIVERCSLGIQHEKQHQELILTDIKYSLYKNPLYPAYTQIPMAENFSRTELAPQHWCDFQAGLVTLGIDTNSKEFQFDNETPAHQVFLPNFSLSNRLVSNAEYQAFIDDGGYCRAELWLSDGWAQVQQNNWQQPLYWREHNGKAMEYSLYGLIERNPDSAAIHLSLYEADAYANWAEARLPTEFEWEFAAKQQAFNDNIKDALHSSVATGDETLLQMFDTAWQGHIQVFL